MGRWLRLLFCSMVLALHVGDHLHLETENPAARPCLRHTHHWSRHYSTAVFRISSTDRNNTIIPFLDPRRGADSADPRDVSRRLFYHLGCVRRRWYAEGHP